MCGYAGDLELLNLYPLKNMYKTAQNQMNVYTIIIHITLAVFLSPMRPRFRGRLFYLTVLPLLSELEAAGLGSSS